MTLIAEAAVLDASAVVEMVLGTPLGVAVGTQLTRFVALHAPAHLDADVLSALGRLQRAGALDAPSVAERLARLAGAPIERHHLAHLLLGAWSRRDRLRLVDALYVELAEQLGASLVTTDAALAAAAGVPVAGG